MGKVDLSTGTLYVLIFTIYYGKFFCFKYMNKVFSVEPAPMLAVTELTKL